MSGRTRNADDAAAVPRWKHQYDLRANSNLVLQGDTPRSKTANEPTGEPESLKDKGLHTFGDLAQRRKAPVEDHLKKRDEEKKKKRNAPDPDEMERPAKRSRTSAPTTSVLDHHELEGIKYQPRTKETKQAYDSLLTFVRQKLGDQQRSIIMSAADEILATIKDEEIKPKEKQQLLDGLLQKLSPDDYAQLHKICKDITDYVDDGDGGEGVGEDEGIAVTYFGGDDDDEEEGKEAEKFAVDEGESEEEEAGEETEILPTVHAQEEGDDEDKALILDPSSIDAYWLQRELVCI